MVDVVIQSARVLYHIYNDKGDEAFSSSSFSKTFCQSNFSETFKGRHIIREPYRDLKCLITKHFRVQSEHKRIQNSFKHPGKVFA